EERSGLLVDEIDPEGALPGRCELPVQILLPLCLRDLFIELVWIRQRMIGDVIRPMFKPALQALENSHRERGAGYRTVVAIVPATIVIPIQNLTALYAVIARRAENSAMRRRDE